MLSSGPFHQFAVYNLVFVLIICRRVFVLVGPGNFVECPTGVRLECTVLKQAMLSFSG